MVEIDGDVEHFAELAGLLDVAAGVGNGARSHCRLALFVVFGSTRDVEAAAELVGWYSSSHFRERK